MTKKRERRFPVALGVLYEVRLVLAGYTRRTTKTGMAERLIIDALSNGIDWTATLRDLRHEAALRQIRPEELLKEIVKQEKLDSILEVDTIDWSVLLEDLPAISPDLDTE